jgi:hypothetical protein
MPFHRDPGHNPQIRCNGSPTNYGYLASVVILSALGCGPEHRQTYPVRGVITQHDSQPLNGGIVSFTTETELYGQVVAKGQISADGSFQLSTYKVNDGAVAGRHQVTIRPAMGGGEAGAFASSPIAKKYLGLDTTDLEFEINEEEKELMIQLDRPESDSL